ncbi:CotH kinase family protein [Verrucomicrobiaceae bacterium N1E253]|uniref:CotH kinase family protein n=2 Tax=Oceaniferula marina TaxID=2748318 RepID=A0A851GRY8_9BACT|nr:CotH kinase family protein [Oceaniferula marina]
MADNDSGIRDEDGDRSDWIEIHNDGSQVLDLAGWHLTDESSDLVKWRFPSVQLDAGASLLVWASSKDRRVSGSELHTNFKLSKGGEYLALVAPDGASVEHAFSPSYPPQVADVSYGMSSGVVTSTVVRAGAEAQAGVPLDASDFAGHFAAWNSDIAGSFSSSGWRTVHTGAGYDANSGYGSWLGADANFQSDLRYQTYSLFLRVKFQLDDPDVVSELKLRMRWDDGMVAYINGVRVASDAAPDDLSWNAQATANRNESLNEDWTTFSIDPAQVGLQEGENLLAIQCMNVTLSSSDLLILPELDVLIPSESTESLYFTSPTPGSMNGGGSIDLPPLVSEVTDVVDPLPLGGPASVPITVHATVSKTMHNVETVRLYYRRMFEPEVMLTMRDAGTQGDVLSGDGIYTVQIPTVDMASGEMMRWRVEAEDEEGNVMAMPRYADPTDSDQYFGTIAHDPSLATSSLPVLHWFIENPSAANSRGGTRACYYYLGRFYDNIQVDLHGQTTSGFGKKSYDIDFNKGNRFLWKEGEGEVKDINLLTNWADKTKMRNTLAYEIFKKAGAAHHYAFPVRVQQNGSFFSIADMVEDGDDRFLERIGLDGNGALYKMYNRLTGPGSKKTRLDEGNDDIKALVAALDESRSQSLRRLYAYDNVDIPSTVNYLAGLVLAGSQDQGHKNYYVYRDSDGTGEWMPIVWDVDLSLGHDWGGQGYFDDDLNTNNVLQLGASNRLKTLIWDSPELNAMFVRRVRTLMDEILQESSTPLAERYFENRIDALAEMMDPAGVASGASDADLDFTKWGSWQDGGGYSTSDEHRMRAQAERLKNDYLPGRRAYLYSSAPESDGLSIPAAPSPSPLVSLDLLDFNPESGNQAEEYLVLKNWGAESLDLSGWTLRGAVEMTIKPGTVLPAGDGEAASQYRGLLHIAKEVSAFRARASGPTGGEYRFIQGGYSGQLSARGETLELYDAKGRLVDSMTYSGAPTPAQESLRVVEINYHPADPSAAELEALPGVTAEDFEWLELVNIGADELSLQGARFDEGVDYVFSAVVDLSPGEHLLLVKNQEAFVLRYGNLTNVYGPYDGQLANGGERLKLVDVSGEEILDFSWNDKWYPPSDGAGYTLVIRDPYCDFRRFDEVSSWGIGEVVSGTPGSGNRDYYVHVDAWRYEQFSKDERDDTLVSSDDADPDGDGRSNWNEYCFGTDPLRVDEVRQRLLASEVAGNEVAVVEFSRRSKAFDIDWRLLASSDMQTWEPEASGWLGDPEAGGLGLEQVMLHSNTRMDAGGGCYFRVQARQRSTP